MKIEEALYFNQKIDFDNQYLHEKLVMSIQSDLSRMEELQKDCTGNHDDELDKLTNRVHEKLKILSNLNEMAIERLVKTNEVELNCKRIDAERELNERKLKNETRNKLLELGLGTSIFIGFKIFDYVTSKTTLKEILRYEETGVFKSFGSKEFLRQKLKFPRFTK